MSMSWAGSGEMGENRNDGLASTMAGGSQTPTGLLQAAVTKGLNTHLCEGPTAWLTYQC